MLRPIADPSSESLPGPKSIRTMSKLLRNRQGCRKPSIMSAPPLVPRCRSGNPGRPVPAAQPPVEQVDSPWTDTISLLPPESEADTERSEHRRLPQLLSRTDALLAAPAMVSGRSTILAACSRPAALTRRRKTTAPSGPRRAVCASPAWPTSSHGHGSHCSYPAKHRHQNRTACCGRVSPLPSSLAAPSQRFSNSPTGSSITRTAG